MEKKTNTSERSSSKVVTTGYKLSEYGRQLKEKQKVKEIYGIRERQFRRFFDIASRGQEATGEALLSLLERRLDNVLYRAKLANTRTQARQIIVHGHILVNNKKVYSPSYLVKVSDEVTVSSVSTSKPAFIDQVVDKRLNTAAKVPDWIELDKKTRKGKVLRFPVRADIQMPIEEHLIVELYSK
ncbi:30S ribosomal protein S4 [Candidatus Babela massiliensis]|uniref:Small ribosomal subunit protein uS4 n=1 Tax=Candidatus Babela massiliensis TaxID=673862 RepID=V6DFY1_9BACT|nr:30S ribosomal protein S4 [Candidatus Babela massiliensis]CDK30487.1 ribosomal protein S4 [Candidatus Babela massiliensis]